MNVVTAYKWHITGRDVVVTILDDGIEKDHPDLKKNYVRLDRSFLSCSTVYIVTYQFLSYCGFVSDHLFVTSQYCIEMAERLRFVLALTTLCCHAVLEGNLSICRSNGTSLRQFIPNSIASICCISALLTAQHSGP